MRRDIPYHSVIMVKEDTGVYPRRSLPEGYSFSGYSAGNDTDWAEIHFLSEQFENVESAVKRFADEFLQYHDKLPGRCCFVLDPAGKPIATSTLWEGDTLGILLQRVHWVCVAPGHRGKGIAGALLTKMLDIYHDLGCRGVIYLTTQTWSYDAVNIYLSFGFRPYRGPKPQAWPGTDDEFYYNNEKAWKIIFEKIAEYRK